MTADDSPYEEDKEVSCINSFATILGSVWSTQARKSTSYKIGISTVMLIATFVTVILSISYLQQVFFLQMAQANVSDIDLIIS